MAVAAGSCSCLQAGGRAGRARFCTRSRPARSCCRPRAFFVALGAVLRARPCKMAVAAGCNLIGQPGGRAGRVLGGFFAAGSLVLRRGPCAGQEARHQERHRRPAPAGVPLNEN